MDSITTSQFDEEHSNSPIAITNYSKTQRIVLLLDLNPLLHISNPTTRTRFLTHLSAAVKTLISFPPLSSSLFSLRPFFSSLPSIVSSSKSQFCCGTLSFDRPDAVVRNLEVLLSNFTSVSTSTKSFWPRAVNLAAAMSQLVCDYDWSQVIFEFSDSSNFSRTNLVVLFSPIFNYGDLVTRFLDLSDVGLFGERFLELFGSVKDMFIRNDIHFSWIDLSCDFELESGSDKEQFGVKSKVLEESIKGLGWGFCSSDSIILGSSLAGFGLIYPRIGISSGLFDCKKDDFGTIRAELSLEILDVKGKPLECKCYLELINLDMFRNDNKFWGGFNDEVVRLQVKALYKCEEGLKFKGKLSNPVLLSESSQKFKNKKDQHGDFGEFFADKVMEVLAKDMCNIAWIKVDPVWQILLSFLYREGYWAIVSFSNSNGGSCTGIIQPFTLFSAILCVVDDEYIFQSSIHEHSGVNLAPIVVAKDEEICKPDTVGTYGGKFRSRNNKKQSSLYQDMVWDSFCKVALDCVVIDMANVYFASRGNSSKKLRFLKCWMKQIRKSVSCSLKIDQRPEPKNETIQDVENRVNLTQESERPFPSSISVGEEALTGASRVQDDAAIDTCSETLESFFTNLDKKMQQGIESEGVDLGTLAERLVNSCIYWLYQKHEDTKNSKSEAIDVKPEDDSGIVVAAELTKLLIKEPKELINSHRSSDVFTQAADPRSTGYASEYIVRLYELQILFRMEILQSEIGSNINEPTKHKFVKQICLLLETIQCHLQGGFFGDWSLDSYVGKLIKSRYGESLGDMVSRIYTKMDLLLFAEEDESPNPLLNSEDSNQSWRDTQQRDDMGQNICRDEPKSAQDKQQSDSESPHGTRREEHARKVMQARKRRERAKRFSSFTSWVPDLQRVWAPKQLKPSWKPTKRKNRSGKYDKVCETPPSGDKRHCSLRNSTDDEGNRDCSGNPVSKALFQDDL